MDNFHEVYPIILDHFQRGFTEEDVFEKICQDRGLKLSSSSTVKLADRIRTRDLEQDISEVRHVLICTITDQYLKFRHAIFNQQNLGRSADLMLND